MLTNPAAHTVLHDPRVLSLGLMCRRASRERGAALIHFQVQAAAVQSHFNTNCFLPDKCACAPRLTPPVSACGATLVAVDTNTSCSPHLKRGKTPQPRPISEPSRSRACLQLSPLLTARILDGNYVEVFAPLHTGCGQPG